MLGVMLVLMVVFSGIGLIMWTTPQTPTVTSNQVASVNPPSPTPVPEQVKGVETEPGIEELTAGWPTYTNSRYHYTFKYPPECVTGDWPSVCQETVENQRPSNCLCRLDTSDEDAVIMENYPGGEGPLTMARLEIIHYSSEFYNPPPGQNLVAWLQQLSGDPAVPNTTNYTVAGIPAVKIDTPPTPLEFAKQNLYLIHDDKLFNISLLNQPPLYDHILSSLKFD